MPHQSVDQGRRLPIIALCFVIAVLEGYDIQAIGVAAPRMVTSLALSSNQLGLVFSISNIGIVIGAGLGGWLADRLGRRVILVGTVAVFALATLATLLVSGFLDLFIVRLATGLGLGAALPNIMALGGEISPPDKRRSTTSMMFCGMPLGGAGSAFFVSLLPVGEWKSVFIVGGLLPLLITPLLYKFLPGTRPGSQSIKPVGVVAGLFGERRALPTLLLAAAYFPMLLILYLFLNWLPTLIVANGLPRTLAPQVSFAFNMGGVVGGLILGRILDHFGFRWPAVGAYIALIIAMIELAAAGTSQGILVFSAAAGFALLGMQFGLYGVAVSYYPAGMKGLGAGWVVAVGRIGSIVGPLIAGIWLAHGATSEQVIASMVPYAAFAAIAVFALSYIPCEKRE